MGTTGKTFDVIPQVPKSSHWFPPGEEERRKGGEEERRRGEEEKRRRGGEERRRGDEGRG